MAIEVRVPTLGESVSEATIGKWFKKVGDAINADEPLLELETDKVALEVPAPASGVLSKIEAQEGENVTVNALLGFIEEGAGAVSQPAGQKQEESAPSASPGGSSSVSDKGGLPPAPSAHKMMEEKGLNADQLMGSGKRGQILKGDVLEALEKGIGSSSATAAPTISLNTADEARVERVRMTKLRQTIARRLKDAQNTAAMLTTFNEVDMSAVMELRKKYKDLFEKKHNIKLGFMGFFTKAVCRALKEIPAVNAQIDGTDIIYQNYVHAAIAVGTPKGLVVPVVRDADQMTIAQIEKEIARLGGLAREGKLTVQDMQGGTFTITNGGVYGSLMSTTILNAPQSGILGMHAIKERPVVVEGQIVIRPMMYLALSYDHRIVDGQEAVTFLVRIKECLEDPERFVLDL